MHYGNFRKRYLVREINALQEAQAALTKAQAALNAAEKESSEAYQRVQRITRCPCLACKPKGACPYCKG